LTVRSTKVGAAGTLFTEYHSTVRDRIRAVEVMVGNTPLLAVHYRYRGRERIVYAKAEFLNLTGSIKDRMALHVLECAYRDGSLQPGDTLAEATSGNTGIAFAALGRALGHSVVIYMPDWMSEERFALIGSLGARIETVSKTAGGFLGSISRCEELARECPGTFLPCQFSNQANVEAHERTTGPELVRQIGRLGRTVDIFVAGVGTGGTVMGVGRYLRNRQPAVRIHPLEPAESPTLTTGIKVGRHRIQGISDEFIPAICQLKDLDRVIAVSDGDAILMAQKLASTLGLGVGVSSGANFLGAVRAAEGADGDPVVATVFCDDNKKYLSTDLMRTEPVINGYLTPEIELLRYEALARAY
jgi:cysteine synthase A